MAGQHQIAEGISRAPIGRIIGHEFHRHRRRLAVDVNNRWRKIEQARIGDDQGRIIVEHGTVGRESRYGYRPGHGRQIHVDENVKKTARREIAHERAGGSVFLHDAQAPQSHARAGPG